MLTEKIMVIGGLTIAVASLLLAAATHTNGIAVGALLGLGLVLYAER